MKILFNDSERVMSMEGDQKIRCRSSQFQIFDALFTLLPDFVFLAISSRVYS